jgi:sugar phosphate isomerase/epimerase
VFIERTDPSAVRLQLDTGNMLMGGGDPFAYLAKHRARYWSFHLKDVVADRKHDVDLGQGILDIPRFLREAGDLSGKPLFVEQEGSADAMESARKNVVFMRAAGF